MGWFHNLLLLRTRPVNRLEETLLAFLREETGIEPFLDELRRCRVYVLIRLGRDGDPAGGFQPLMIAGTQGAPVLCIFTSPERARGLQKSSGFEHGMEIELAALLRMVPPGVGLAVNAGTLFSTEALPPALDELR